MKKKSFLLATMLMAVIMIFGGSVYAFQDIANVPGKDKIESLKKQGVLNGVNDGKFLPQGTVSNAQAVTMIVKGLGLNIDHIRFIKEPKASDYFTKVPDDAWYANSFIIAQLNGLDLPKDINPAASITREQFAHYLFQGLTKKGDYAFIELFIMIKDEAKVNQAYMDSIQKLLVSKIAELDKEGNFRPKQPITRAEAAVMLYNTIQFVKNTKPIEPEPGPVDPAYDVKLSVQNVNEQIKQVTLSADLPNPGYGLAIDKIEFSGNEAYLYYRVIQPDPDRFYAQVITTKTVDTYIAAAYTPVLRASAKSTVSN